MEVVMRQLRSFVGTCLTAALLAACGGGSVPSLSMPTPSGSINTPPGGNRVLAVFNYTGKRQKFVVPAGITKVTVVARGASGGGFASSGYAPPGLGGALKATIAVRPAERLIVYVGGEGSVSRSGGAGFNGGGLASPEAGGGGGSSDVRTGKGALRDRILVAAGGGGAGETVYYYTNNGSGSCIGGNGGGGGSVRGADGGNGACGGSGSGGAGGSSKSGGYGGPGGRGGNRSGSCSGNAGGSGSLLDGGYGGDGCAGAGGGGGGGYYGGGGGGNGALFNVTTYSGSAGTGGGGGGGSSYVEKGAIRVVDQQGVWGPGNGEVIISKAP